MRLKLETEMHRLHTSILHMGTLAEEALHKALTALSTGDASLAALVVQEDSRIDILQQDIEDQVTRVIATEQPVAEDLRILITCIKLTADIERIGDHARHIAKAVDRISRQSIELVLPLLVQMSELGTGMLHDVLSAFMDGDPSLATQIAATDDKIDELHKQAYDEVIQHMQDDPAHIPDGTNLLLLCRFLERMGDHVTNMCEWVVYAKHGTHVELNG